MPEQPQQGGAQNKLGELFVQFSTKGLPSLLKNLNSVSASFLLGKNAASQFADTLSKPFKEAGNTAIGIGRMSSALGATTLEYQKLTNYLKKHGVGDALAQDIEKFNSFFTLFHTGRTDMSQGMADAMANLGLSPQDYLGSYEDSIRLIEDVGKRISGMSKQEQNTWLDLMGISKDLAYLIDRGGFNLQDALTIPDEAIQKNIDMKEALNELAISLKNFQDMLASKLAPPITALANKLTGYSEKIQKDPEEFKRAANVVAGAAAGGAIAGPGGAVVGAISAEQGNRQIRLQKMAGGGNGKYVNLAPGANLDFNNLFVDPRDVNPNYEQNQKARKNKNGQLTGPAAPVPPIMDLSNEPSGAVPSNTMQNLTQTINITNQNNITGSNAQEIADKIAGINSQDIQYNQYQLQNLAGL